MQYLNSNISQFNCWWITNYSGLSCNKKTKIYFIVLWSDRTVKSWLEKTPSYTSTFFNHWLLLVCSFIIKECNLFHYCCYIIRYLSSEYMTRLLKNLLLSLTHKQCNIFRIKMLKSLHIIARRLSRMSNNIKFVTHVVLKTVKSVNIHNCAI